MVLGPFQDFFILGWLSVLFLEGAWVRESLWVVLGKDSGILVLGISWAFTENVLGWVDAEHLWVGSRLWAGGIRAYYYFVIW